MTHTASLAEHRKLAAEASLGMSAPAILEAVAAIASERGLKGSLLDFSAGKGEFIRLILTAPGSFSRIVGVDLFPRPQALSSDVEWISVDLNEEVPTSEEFDVVVAIEAIEHLENPWATMRQIFRLLKSGGTAIVTTPNSENIRGYVSLLARRHFWAFTGASYPAHITALLEMDLRRAAIAAGLVDLEFDYRVPGGIPKIPTVPWSRLGLRGRLFCDNVVVVGRKP
jgi:2-polyprenyl-3-methyl-5-hydroxy-6-metoxy-1,4-benzoquinol methylase